MPLIFDIGLFLLLLLLFSVLTPDGIKLATWNKSLPFPLTDQGLVKVMKAGFTAPTDIMTLMTDDEVEDIELTVRDKAALRKIVQDSQREMAA